MEKQTKTQKGITLLSLIITILVLLILVAIAVNQITDDNATINVALAAKNQVEQEMKEKNELLDKVWDWELPSGDTVTTPGDDDITVTPQPNTHECVWGEVKPITEPTCTEDGTGIQYCTITGCEETKDAVIDALGHDLSQYGKKEPTCTEEGHSAYEECQRENCEYSTKQVLAKRDHDYEDTGITGYNNWKHSIGKVCTMCGNPPEGEAGTFEEHTYRNYKIYKAGILTNVCVDCGGGMLETDPVECYHCGLKADRDGKCDDCEWECDHKMNKGENALHEEGYESDYNITERRIL